jgi:hypothetical protein
MVDKPNRMEAAKLIEDFVSCRITNFEFRDGYPRSDDPALFAIYSMVWFFYSDVSEHRLEGKHAPTGESRQVFERSILFLKAESEYHGPTNFRSLSAPFKRIWYRIVGRTEPELSPFASVAVQQRGATRSYAQPEMREADARAAERSARNAAKARWSKTRFVSGPSSGLFAATFSFSTLRG